MRKILILAFIALVAPNTYSQQEISPDLFRRINYNVIRLIENYESYCTFTGFNSDISFYSLFSDNAIIYNDYLPKNDKQELSPLEYYNLTQDDLSKSTIGVEISNLSFIDSLEVRGRSNYGIKLKLTKGIYFRNWNNFRYPDRKFILNFKILINVINSNKIDCKIESITSETQITEFCVAKFSLKDVDLINDPIKIKDEILEIEGKNNEITVFIPNITNPKGIIKIESYDAYLNIKSDTAKLPDKNIYFVDVRNYKYDIGLNLQYNITSNYQLNSIEDITNSLLKNISSTTYGYGIGIDFNRKIAKLGRTNFYLNTGIGLEKTGIEFSGSNYNEYSALDVDGDSYLRQVQLNNIKEKIDLNYLYLPIGIKFKYLLNKKFSLEAGGGAKVYYLVSNSYSASTSTSYKGYYDQYDKLTMDHYYDYGYFDLSMQDKTIELPKLNYGVFANFGASYRINQKYTASIKCGYDYTFVNMANYKGAYILSENQHDYTSLYYAYQSILKNNLNIKIGINYNF
ncbi:MAG: hypothetical protein GZ091_13955 [Paludibacter sp.]|nr:hypothetical protein [Paludibacter sp.]